MTQFLSFTPSQFFEVFAAYNAAVWPAQIVAYAAAAAVVAEIYLAPQRAASFALIVLAALWAWTGLLYHFVHFRAINPAATLFAVLFILHAGILLFRALNPRLEFASRDAANWPGWTMIIYATAIYPLVNVGLGHAYPRAPSFGVTPCPLVIFTLGVLVLSRWRIPWILFAAPLIWAVIGGSAAFVLDVRADFALPVAAIAAVLLNARKLQAPLARR